jgi:hypothetical protein
MKQNINQVLVIFISPSKRIINLNYIEIQSVPRSKHIRLGYKNQPVNAVQGNNRCLFSDRHKTQNTLCGQNVEFVNVTPSGTYINHWAELYINIQSVPSSKHTPSRLYKPVS